MACSSSIAPQRFAHLRIRLDDVFRRLRRGDGSGRPQERITGYLRPFDITGRVKLDEGEFLDQIDGNASQEQHNVETKRWDRTTLSLVRGDIGVKESVPLFNQNSEIETHFERALRGAGHFIALGRPGEALGAGRLPTEEADRQGSVSLLVKAANLCILIPSARPGTQWEVRHIDQGGHLDKCCNEMLPEIGRYSCKQEWEAARTALADVLPLPEYRAQGRVFRYDVNGMDLPAQVPTEARRIGSVPEALAVTIQTLFPELPRWDVEDSHGWIHAGVHGALRFQVGNGGASAGEQ